MLQSEWLRSKHGWGLAEQRLRFLYFAWFGESLSQSYLRGGSIEVAGGEPPLADRERLAQQGFRRGRIVLKLPGHGHFDQRRGYVGILIAAEFGPHLQRLAISAFVASNIA